ncbi:MAG: hypothetical protein HY820_21995 [Acidobacteria bacterium]|nr:hypothetical protein [Acidobacteriota bacterium]
MKTTVEIDDALFRKSKQYCAKQGVPFRVLVESGLRRVIEPDKPTSPFRMKPFGFKGGGKRGEGQQVRDWAAIREMIYEDNRGAPGTGES